jgi:hypothetical protein
MLVMAADEMRPLTGTLVATEIETEMAATWRRYPVKKKTDSNLSVSAWFPSCLLLQTSEEGGGGENPK